MGESRKLYLRQNYRSITLGSSDRIKDVHSESDGSGSFLFYVIGGDQDEAFLLSMDYLSPTVPTIHPALTRGDAEKESVADRAATDPAEYVEQGTTPDKFFCQDHEVDHAKEDAEYYLCLDKFLTGQWAAKPSATAQPSEEEEESLEDRLEAEAEVEALAEKTAQEAEVRAEAKVDNRTHSLNLVKVRALVSTIDDAKELQALLDGERLHPEYPNGRKGALTAIQERLESI